MKHPPICDLEWDHNIYTVKVPGKRLEQKFNAFFLFFVYTITFPRLKMHSLQSPGNLDILPKKTKNGLKPKISKLKKLSRFKNRSVKV